MTEDKFLDKPLNFYCNMNSIKSVNKEIDDATQYLYSKTIIQLFETDIVQEFSKRITFVAHTLSGKENRNNHENYFNNFTLVWKLLLMTRNIIMIEDFWNIILDPIYKWENRNYPKRIHKGSPFYYLGASFLQFSLVDKGYLYFHKSYSEDLITHDEDNPSNVFVYANTPSYKLLTLDYHDTGQYYLNYVRILADFINNYIDLYNKHVLRSFTLLELREKFLNDPNQINITLLFSFTIARIHNIYFENSILKLNLYETKNNLSLHLLGSIYFDLLKITEGLIKNTSSGLYYFSDCLKFFVTKISKPFQIEDHIKFFENQRKMSPNQAFLNLHSNQLIFSNNFKPNELEKSIILSIGIRNYFAHNSNPLSVFGEKQPDIIRSLLFLLFSIVDFLYENITD